jgi:phenylacetate-CoA ligase
MTENNISPPESVKIVTTGAENLTAISAKCISEAFRAPIFQHYGLAESTANFSQEPNGKLYVDEDFSHVEFPLSLDGLSRKIVGTNWHNPAFPLFRYDSGDLCQLTLCEVKGPRSREILSIDGREEDVVILNNGVHLTRLDQIFAEQINIRNAQIYQTVIGEAEFRIVKGTFYKNQDEIMLKEAINQKFGDKCKYDIVYVDQLERTTNGKLRLVISTIRKT